MSRSGYSDDLEPWDLIRWRGAVNSAIKGKRGQSFLREMATALDAMPEKKLIEGALVADMGEVCALGAVAVHRKMNVENLDPEDSERIAGEFDIAKALAKEIMAENDDVYFSEPPEKRWKRMRNWVESNLVKS